MTVELASKKEEEKEFPSSDSLFQLFPVQASEESAALDGIGSPVSCVVSVSGDGDAGLLDFFFFFFTFKVLTRALTDLTSGSEWMS